MRDWQAIENAIGQAIGQSFRIVDRWRCAGGDINETHVVTDGQQRYFVKCNQARYRDMFAVEARGLNELGQVGQLRIPEPVTQGHTGDVAFLVLEYIDLQRPTRRAMQRLGKGLAEMHGITAPRFGWSHDNWLGRECQHNARHADWCEFWRENRLAVMLDALAPEHPTLARDGDRLLSALPELLADHRPEASLVHGDLWAGNAGMDTEGWPVIYDPAIYYGDRETDLAMTELFGGFGPGFHQAYWQAWPMSPGYREIRRPLYQLYHLLNHVRMFGGGFAAEARHVMGQLLARV